MQKCHTARMQNHSRTVTYEFIVNHSVLYVKIIHVRMRLTLCKLCGKTLEKFMRNMAEFSADALVEAVKVLA